MTNRNIVVVQYAGDLLEADFLRAETGTETYHAHGYMLDSLAAFNTEFSSCVHLSCLSGRVFDETGPSGVRLIGSDLDPGTNTGEISERIRSLEPTHVVLMSPIYPLLKDLQRRTKARLLCMIADSFQAGNLRARMRHARLARLLNDPQIDWVANHGPNACNSLRDIGVSPNKILRWDWPHSRNPQESPGKTLAPKEAPRLFFAGSITRTKGVGDAIEAVAILKRAGINAKLDLAGDGDIQAFRMLADELQVSSQVQLLGRVSNNEVFQRMIEASAVLVPSHHEYPEGLPLTIYESLASRTPIVASDHPMFRGILVDRSTSLVYPAGDSRLLAERIRALHDDPLLYKTLSDSTVSTWETIRTDATWAEIIRRWCRDRPEDSSWIAAHTIGNLLRQP